MMARNDSMADLMDRIQRNAAHLAKSYQKSNDLLNAAVGEAFPWVIGLPAVQKKIPSMFHKVLPQGIPVRLDYLERLATQLFAILAASYGTQDPPTGAMPDPLTTSAPAKIINLKER